MNIETEVPHISKFSTSASYLLYSSEAA